MHPVRALLILGLMQPPVAADGRSTLGIAWHEQATVAPELQQRLVQEVATAAGIETGDVERDVVGRARWIVAFEVGRTRAQGHARARADLDAAADAYRSGDLTGASAAVARLLQSLVVDPVVPGTAALVWRAHVLRARIAHTQGDDAALTSALRDALVLDPEAVLSTRDVPPAVAQRHAVLQRELLAGRSQWVTPRVTLPKGVVDPTLHVEIDGVPGLRPVPPGRHLLVARRAGMAPVGEHADVTGGWSVPSARRRLAPGLPVRGEAAQTVCDGTEVDTLVLARTRGDRLGLQAYRCDEGYGDTWYGTAATLPAGVQHVLGATRWAAKRSPLLEDARWVPTPRVRPQQPVDRPQAPEKTRWYQRAWVWLVIGSVVLAGAATGVALGTTSSRAAVTVDGDSFR